MYLRICLHGGAEGRKELLWQWQLERLPRHYRNFESGTDAPHCRYIRSAGLPSTGWDTPGLRTARSLYTLLCRPGRRAAIDKGIPGRGRWQQQIQRVWYADQRQDLEGVVKVCQLTTFAPCHAHLQCRCNTCQRPSNQSTEWQSRCTGRCKGNHRCNGQELYQSFVCRCRLGWSLHECLDGIHCQRLWGPAWQEMV